MSNRKPAAKKAAKKSAPTKGAKGKGKSSTKPAAQPAAPAVAANWNQDGDHWNAPAEQLRTLCEKHHTGKIPGEPYKNEIQPLKEQFDNGGRTQVMYDKIQKLAKTYLK